MHEKFTFLHARRYVIEIFDASTLLTLSELGNFSDFFLLHEIPCENLNFSHLHIPQPNLPIHPSVDVVLHGTAAAKHIVTPSGVSCSRFGEKIEREDVDNLILKKNVDVERERHDIQFIDFELLMCSCHLKLSYFDSFVVF